MKKYKILLVMVVFFALLPTAALFYLSSSHYAATADVLAMLGQDPLAVVEKDRVEFWPQHQEAQTGLIIYPGGNVDFKAYAPLAADISKAGYFVVVVRMPLNLAVFNKDRADDIIDRYPEITTWALAGHSLGGVMAARYALENSDKVQGLILWASYPDKDMSATDLKALSVFATNDGILNSQRFEEAKPNLPADAVLMPIPGGNHSYFGSYGFQRGDLAADIRREEQQGQIVDAAVLFLNRLEIDD